jgi:peptide/nickel transport system substrate-binding protein
MAAAGLLLGTAFITGVQARNADHTAGASPTYGGTIVMRGTTAPDCLDPQKTSTDAANAIDALILDPLLSFDPKGHYTGDLATKYSVVNKAGTKIDFFLRKGVRFSNGDPFTATDVKYTFDRAIDPATKSPATAEELAAVQSTKVINKHEVQLDLSTPSRPLLTNLANAYTGILDHRVGGSCTNQIGTGIYRLTSTGVGFQDIKLTANKYHNFAPSWVKNKGVPWITHLEEKVIPSDATAISDLLAGGLEISDVPGTQLTRVQGNKSFTLHKLPSQNETYIEFNTSHPPFNNGAVRRAFAELLDRKNIVRVALNGLGQPVYGPIPPAIPYYDKNVANSMPKFNPAKAAQVIAANHATGPYTFMVYQSPDYSTEAEIIQAAAGQAGMQLNIVNKAGIGDFVAAAKSGLFDVLILGYGSGDPDVMYHLLGSKGNHWTFGNTPQLENLLLEGETTLQKKKVAKIYDQAQELINKQAELIGLDSEVPIFAFRTTIHGFHTDVRGNPAYQDLYIKTK